MKIVVTGDREWTDRGAIRHMLELLSPTLVIHGGQRGADLLAEEVAVSMGIETLPFPAKWQRYGNRAGPIRNRQMLSEDPDAVVWFHADLSRSKGTRDCVFEARERGIPTIPGVGSKDGP